MLKSKNRIGWAIISFVFIDNLTEPSISIPKASQEAKIRQSKVKAKHVFNRYKKSIKTKALYSIFPLVFPLRDFFSFKYFYFIMTVMFSSKFYRIEFESNSLVLYK